MYLILGAWTGAGGFVQYDLATPWGSKNSYTNTNIQIRWR